MKMAHEPLTMNVKKIISWGTGLAVFVTKEAKVLGWTDKNYVIITSMRDKDGESIVIRRAPVPDQKSRRH